MITFKINPSEVLDALRNTRGRLYAEGILGIQKGLSLFEGFIVKRFMSGRPGLRRITSNLAHSWFVGPIEGGARLATRTVYARTHEYGDASRNIPRRMFIRDDFKTFGRDMIVRAIADRWHRLSRMGVALG